MIKLGNFKCYFSWQGGWVVGGRGSAVLGSLLIYPFYHCLIITKGRGGGGLLPYIGYIGQCEAPKGIVFSAVWSEIGYQF